jgi:hypothetical protein
MLQLQPAELAEDRIRSAMKGAFTPHAEALRALELRHRRKQVERKSSALMGFTKRAGHANLWLFTDRERGFAEAGVNGLRAVQRI